MRVCARWGGCRDNVLATLRTLGWLWSPWWPHSDSWATCGWRGSCFSGDRLGRDDYLATVGPVAGRCGCRLRCDGLPCPLGPARCCFGAPGRSRSARRARSTALDRGCRCSLGNTRRSPSPVTLASVPVGGGRLLGQVVEGAAGQIMTDGGAPWWDGLGAAGSARCVLGRGAAWRGCGSSAGGWWRRRGRTPTGRRTGRRACRGCRWRIASWVLRAVGRS